MRIMARQTWSGRMVRNCVLLERLALWVPHAFHYLKTSREPLSEVGQMKCRHPSLVPSKWLRSGQSGSTVIRGGSPSWVGDRGRKSGIQEGTSGDVGVNLSCFSCFFHCFPPKSETPILFPSFNHDIFPYPLLLIFYLIFPAYVMRKNNR